MLPSLSNSPWASTCRLREQRERLEALKADDVAWYMQLAQGRKNARIEALLGQTDGCLRRLAARLHVAAPATTAGTTVGAGAPAGSSGDPRGLSSAATATPASRAADACVGGGGGDAEALQESHQTWVQLSAAIRRTGEEVVKAQPALLGGGELRPYQMEGVQWMVGLRQHGLNGILADEMVGGSSGGCWVCGQGWAVTAHGAGPE